MLLFSFLFSLYAVTSCTTVCGLGLSPRHWHRCALSTPLTAVVLNEPTNSAGTTAEQFFACGSLRRRRRAERCWGGPRPGLAPATSRWGSCVPSAKQAELQHRLNQRAIESCRVAHSSSKASTSPNVCFHLGMERSQQAAPRSHIPVP